MIYLCANELPRYHAVPSRTRRTGDSSVSETRPGTTANSLAISSQLCFSVYSTAHAFTRLYYQLLQPIDITYTQYLALLALQEEDGITVNALGKRLLLDSGTLTPVLKRLESAGYVRRERDRHDERRVRAYLTERAHGLRPDFERVSEHVFRATGLTPGEIASLQRRLHRLRLALEQAAAG